VIYLALTGEDIDNRMNPGRNIPSVDSAVESWDSNPSENTAAGMTAHCSLLLSIDSLFLEVRSLSAGYTFRQSSASLIFILQMIQKI